MKALIQRVTHASVTVNEEIVGNIDQGLLVFIGIEKQDTKAQADKMLHKLFHYRMFNDSEGKMNLSVKDIEGGLLIVSQFTLAADTKKGLRPSFSSAAVPAEAETIYDYLVQNAQQQSAITNNTVASGRFGADMKVSLLNDGPVTFLLEI